MTSSSSSSNIQVLIRLRPTSIGTADHNNETYNKNLEYEETNGKIIVNRRNKGNTVFTFDHVLGAPKYQRDVFDKCNFTNDVLNGINSCIIAYGQTSSGKTHTLFGSNWMSEDTDFNKTGNQSENNGVDGGVSESISIEDMHSREDFGLVPRSVTTLFDTLNSVLSTNSNNNKKFEFTVHCHVMQIYNERIYDLIQDKRRKRPLQLRDTGITNKVHIKGLSSYRVHSKDDAEALIRRALRNRALRNTDYNIDSSRSHTIVQFFIQVEEEDDSGLMVLRRSTFSFVDLAGSEKLNAKSNDSWQLAVHLDNQAAIKETANINTSLHVLGLCVSSLIEPQKNNNHVPYRSSVLTRILQDQLGGQGKTTLIATVHEDNKYIDETYSTLQFASRASRIKMSVMPISDLNQGQYSKLTVADARKQIEQLKMKLLVYESGNSNNNNNSTSNNTNSNNQRNITPLNSHSANSNNDSSNRARSKSVTVKTSHKNNSNRNVSYDNNATCEMCGELRIMLDSLQKKINTMENENKAKQEQIRFLETENIRLQKNVDLLAEAPNIHLANISNQNSFNTKSNENSSKSNNSSTFNKAIDATSSMNPISTIRRLSASKDNSTNNSAVTSPTKNHHNLTVDIPLHSHSTSQPSPNTTAAISAQGIASNNNNNNNNATNTNIHKPMTDVDKALLAATAVLNTHVLSPASSSSISSSTTEKTTVLNDQHKHHKKEIIASPSIPIKPSHKENHNQNEDNIEYVVKSVLQDMVTKLTRQASRLENQFRLPKGTSSAITSVKTSIPSIPSTTITSLNKTSTNTFTVTLLPAHMSETDKLKTASPTPSTTSTNTNSSNDSIGDNNNDNDDGNMLTKSLRTSNTTSSLTYGLGPSVINTTSITPFTPSTNTTTTNNNNNASIIKPPVITYATDPFDSDNDDDDRFDFHSLKKDMKNRKNSTNINNNNSNNNNNLSNNSIISPKSNNISPNSMTPTSNNHFFPSTKSTSQVTSTTTTTTTTPSYNFSYNSNQNGFMNGGFVNSAMSISTSALHNIQQQPSSSINTNVMNYTASTPLMTSLTGYNPNVINNGTRSKIIMEASPPSHTDFPLAYKALLSPGAAKSKIIWEEDMVGTGSSYSGNLGGGGVSLISPSNGGGSNKGNSQNKSKVNGAKSSGKKR